VVRESLKAGKQLSEQSHPGNGGRPTTRSAVNETATAESASPASSTAGQQSGGGASGSDSSDGNAGGS